MSPKIECQFITFQYTTVVTKDEVGSVAGQCVQALIIEIENVCIFLMAS